MTILDTKNLIYDDIANGVTLSYYDFDEHLINVLVCDICKLRDVGWSEEMIIKLVEHIHDSFIDFIIDNDLQKSVEGGVVLEDTIYKDILLGD